MCETEGTYIPNIEIKFPAVILDNTALAEKKCIVLNKNIILFIAPIELQIPFKIYLGSDKDIEDAQHLYYIFNDKINKSLMREFARKLKIEGELDKIENGSP